MLKQTNTIYNVIHVAIVTQDMIYNFNDYQMTLCKKIITNKNKVKFSNICHTDLLNIIMRV